MVSLTVVRSAAGAAAPSIRGGDILAISVVRRLPDGLWQVRLGGRLFTVRSDIPLAAGQRLRVEAFWSGSTLRLRQTRAEDAVLSHARREGIEIDATGRHILDAMRRSGMPLRGETVDSIRAALRETSVKDRRAARLLCLLADKGIEPDAMMLEALYALAFNDRRDESGRERGGGRDPDGDDAAADIAIQLRRQGSAGNGEGNALSLFNHAPGVHENWRIVPYEVVRGHWRAAGSFRFTTPAGGAATKIAVTARTKSAAWEFVFDEAAQKLTILCDDPRQRAKALAAASRLTEKLRNLSIHVDDIRSSDRYDGFSLEETPGVPQVDTVV